MTPFTSLSSSPSPEQLTRQWFEAVVLGLNLCPFAHKPAREDTIRFVVSAATTDTELLDALVLEMQLLADTPTTTCETTLLITPLLLGDFYDYQFFLDEANRRLKQHGWKGVFQLASFHPNYCFAGTLPEEASNLTNRSPYPIIHILREASLEKVLAHVDQPELIPQENMRKMDALSPNKKSKLFPYLAESS
jgi:uncharacterized protein